MERTLEKILTWLIIILIIGFVTYLVYDYIKAPKSNKIEFPINIVELSGKEVVEWKNYIEDNKPTKMIVYVNHVSSSEPPQIITDKDKIEEVLNIILNLKAESLADRFKSSATRIIYYFEDEKGKSMTFTFQDNLLKLSDGRYYVDNIEALNNVSGIDLYK